MPFVAHWGSAETAGTVTVLTGGRNCLYAARLSAVPSAYIAPLNITRALKCSAQLAPPLTVPAPTSAAHQLDTLQPGGRILRSTCSAGKACIAQNAAVRPRSMAHPLDYLGV